MPSMRVWMLVGLLCVSQGAFACSGCGCAGGPGYRMPSGKCASWVQFKSACNGACFPVGTVDERGGLMLRVPPPVGLGMGMIGNTPASGGTAVTPK